MSVRLISVPVTAKVLVVTSITLRVPLIVLTSLFFVAINLSKSSLEGFSIVSFTLSNSLLAPVIPSFFLASIISDILLTPYEAIKVNIKGIAIPFKFDTALLSSFCNVNS